jgi:hypothetical protein
VKNEDEILFPFNHSMGHKKEEIFLRRWGLRKTNCCTFSLLHLLFPFFTFLFVFLLYYFFFFFDVTVRFYVYDIKVLFYWLHALNLSIYLEGLNFLLITWRLYETFGWNIVIHFFQLSSFINTSCRNQNFLISNAMHFFLLIIFFSGHFWVSFCFIRREI